MCYWILLQYCCNLVSNLAATVSLCHVLIPLKCGPKTYSLNCIQLFNARILYNTQATKVSHNMQVLINRIVRVGGLLHCKCSFLYVLFIFTPLCPSLIEGAQQLVTFIPGYIFNSKY